MSKYIVKKGTNEVQKSDHGKVKFMESSRPSGSFISFQYTYKSMSFSDGKTYVRSKRERFENGRIESEEFEGTMEGNAFMNTFLEMQNQFLKQINSFFNPLSFFLPFSKGDKEKK